MKKLLILCLLMSGTLLYAQQDIKKVATPMDRAAGDSVKSWTILGTSGLNITQAAFSNWAAGGENSSVLALFLISKQTIKRTNTHGKTTLTWPMAFSFWEKAATPGLPKPTTRLNIPLPMVMRYQNIGM